MLVAVSGTGSSPNEPESDSPPLYDARPRGEPAALVLQLAMPVLEEEEEATVPVLAVLVVLLVLVGVPGSGSSSPLF